MQTSVTQVPNIGPANTDANKLVIGTLDQARLPSNINGDSIPKLNALRQVPAAYIPGIHFLTGTQQFQDEIGATWAAGPSPVGVGPVAKDADGNLWHVKITTYVNPRWMYLFNSGGSVLTAIGAVGDFTTNDSPAIQRAFDTAKAYGAKVQFDRGNFYLGAKIDTKLVPFEGAGQDLTVFHSTTLNDSYFVITAPSNANFQGNRYGGFTCQFGGNAPYQNTACIEMAGSGPYLLQYLQFRKIRTNGLYTAFAITKKGQYIPPISGGTPARSGSLVDWMIYDDIECNSFSQAGKYCFWFKKEAGGSGTGSEYFHLGGDVGGNPTGGRNDPTAAFLRFETDYTDPQGNAIQGATIGDFLVTNSQFDNPDTIVSVGPNASYVNNINFVADQIDGGVNCPIKFDGPIFADRDLGPPQGIRMQASNIGGGVYVGACMGIDGLSQSIIPDKNSSLWTAGAIKNFGGGTKSVPFYEVDLHAYSASEVRLTFTGLIGGNGSTASTYDCSITAGAGTAPSAKFTCILRSFNNNDGTTNAPKITLAVAQAGLRGLIFSGVLASNPVGSDIECQISVSGGRHVVKGL